MWGILVLCSSFIYDAVIAEWIEGERGEECSQLKQLTFVVVVVVERPVALI